MGTIETEDGMILASDILACIAETDEEVIQVTERYAKDNYPGVENIGTKHLILEHDFIITYLKTLGYQINEPDSNSAS